MEALTDLIMSYGGIGACLAYFIYKDVSQNKEMKNVISENTKAVSEFTAVLNIIKDMIKK